MPKHRTDAVSYYRGRQVSIDAELGGEMVNVADGGSVDWACRLLSNRREQLFTSGIGLERLLSCPSRDPRLPPSELVKDRPVRIPRIGEGAAPPDGRSPM
jgi:hypothetical protein